MKKRNWILLLLAALVLLAGCRKLFETELMRSEALEERLPQVISALNRRDGDSLYALMYPGTESRGQFDAGFATMEDNWKGSDTYTVQAVSMNISSGGGRKTQEGAYRVTFPQWVCVITLAYVEDAGGSGLQSVHVAPGTAGATVPVSGGSLATIKTPLQWVFLAVTLGQIGLLIYTLVDILRRKPQQYGLWLLISFLAVRPYLVLGNGFRTGFSLGVSAGLWRCLVYANGARQLVLSIPVGLIIYWCKRKALRPRPPKNQSPQRPEF